MLRSLIGSGNGALRQFARPNVARFFGAGTEDLTTLGSTDSYWKSDNDRIEAGSSNDRGFVYLMLGGSRVLMASAGRLAALKLLDMMNPAKDVLALASAEVDLSNIPPGEQMTLKWRGKPVFLWNRTEEEIADAEGVNVATLRDPESDSDRVKKRQWLVVIGVCTHLGCVPIAGAGDYGGYFCPCHGSHYDSSGRIRKGPAPKNLEIPEHTFLSDTLVKVG